MAIARPTRFAAPVTKTHFLALGGVEELEFTFFS
jgi:hypothetical protein